MNTNIPLWYWIFYAVMWLIVFSAIKMKASKTWILSSLVMLPLGAIAPISTFICSIVFAKIAFERLVWLCWNGLARTYLRDHAQGILQGLPKLPTFAYKTSKEYPAQFEVDSVELAHAKYKNHLNSLGGGPDFYSSRMYKVMEQGKGSGVASRAFYKLESIIRAIPLPIGVKTCVDLCSGMGGWTKMMIVEQGLDVTSVSLWTKPTHQKFKADVPTDMRSKLTMLSKDYHSVKPYPVDVFLFDGGEEHHDPEKERKANEKLLWSPAPYSIIDWFELYGSTIKWFAIKILVPGSKLTIARLRRIQEITGKGMLVRLGESRLSNCELYFVSGPVQKDLEGFVINRYSDNTFLLKEAVETGFRFDLSQVPIGRGIANVAKEWEDLQHIGLEGLPKLEPLDMEDSISEYIGDRELFPPTAELNFLKELGWVVTHVTGSKTTIINPIVDSVVGLLKKAYNGITSWRTTSTLPYDTFAVIRNKVDKEPKENHLYYPLLRDAYEAMSKFLKRRGEKGQMRYLRPDEIPTLVNRKAGVGSQLSGIYQSMDDILKCDKVPWFSRVKDFLTKIRTGKPLLGVFNSMGKREKKFMPSHIKGSRLIWFLPGSARLAELHVLGKINSIVKLFPFSVSGLPLYEYGDFLKGMFKDRWTAVADDVAGWDTKVSHGDLRLEAGFLQSLTDDKDLKKDIELIYRLYANKIVAAEDIEGGDFYGRVMMRLLLLRGERGSGETVTYSMNTISNAALQLAKMSFVMNVQPQQRVQWMLRSLEKMVSKSGSWSMCISGDDSVVMGEKTMIDDFANRGMHVNNDTGKLRKDQGLMAPSPIYEVFSHIPFCSHTYVKVKFNGREDSFEKYMPVRSVTEILGKARIMLEMPKEVETAQAWARAIGFQLLITYVHMSTIRMVALSILSATSSTVCLDGLRKPGRYVEEPWLGFRTALAAVNGCVGRDQIDNLSQIETVPVYEELKQSSDRRRWKNALIPTTIELRSHLETLVPGGVYESGLLEKNLKFVELLPHSMRELEGVHERLKARVMVAEAFASTAVRYGL